MIHVDLSGVLPFVSEDISAFYEGAASAQEKLLSGTGAGSDYIGWVNLPESYDKDELQRIKAAAARIKEDSAALVVIGIGGSYLGARAAIEFLRSPNYNLLPKDTPDIYFVGNNFSGEHLQQVIQLLGDRDFSINVISKSGTTTETSIAFRIFKGLAEAKYGKEGARMRTYVTTDKANGIMKQIADEEGYETFVIPDDVGGRYSVLTPVGLLPIAAAGIDIEAVMAGAAAQRQALLATGPDNIAWQYAAYRQLLYRSGKKMELLTCFDPSVRYMGEWWKQLFGESEGKDNVGVFPASAEFSTDLHSLGQYIQEGERILMETILAVAEPRTDLVIPECGDKDGLAYLAGRSMDFVNKQAMAATKKAHISGGVPVFEITVDKMDEENFGRMVYFFEFACGLSGYISGVNPFDQPGVEAYKKNMFALLGKPGYEDLRKNLLNA